MRDLWLAAKKFNGHWCSVWRWSMDVRWWMVTWERWAWLCTKGPMLNVAPGGLQRLQRITVFGTHNPPPPLVMVGPTRTSAANQPLSRPTNTSTAWTWQIHKCIYTNTNTQIQKITALSSLQSTPELKKTQVAYVLWWCTSDYKQVFNFLNFLTFHQKLLHKCSIWLNPSSSVNTKYCNVG